MIPWRERDQLAGVAPGLAFVGGHEGRPWSNGYMHLGRECSVNGWQRCGGAIVPAVDSAVAVGAGGASRTQFRTIRLAETTPRWLDDVPGNTTLQGLEQ
jgi:hypothetical protein